MGNSGCTRDILVATLDGVPTDEVDVLCLACELDIPALRAISAAPTSPVTSALPPPTSQKSRSHARKDLVNDLFGTQIPWSRKL